MFEQVADLGQNQPLRPMKQTETVVTRIDEVYPGLRIIDKFHPPGNNYLDASYQQIVGIKGQVGAAMPLIKKSSI